MTQQLRMPGQIRATIDDLIHDQIACHLMFKDQTQRKIQITVICAPE
jgi:hypothetical protein